MKIDMTVRIAQPATATIGSGGRIDITTGAARSAVHYPSLLEKPQIEGITLVGDKTFSELGLGDITPQDIDRMLFG